MVLYQQGTFLLNCTKFWPSGVFYLIYQFPVPDPRAFTLNNTASVCISVHVNSDIMEEIRSFFPSVVQKLASSPFGNDDKTTCCKRVASHFSGPQ